MRAGRLREYIQIETYTSTQDDYGQESRTWITLAGRRAEVKPMFESAEADHGGKMEGRTMYRFTMRFVDGVTQAARLVWDSRTFEIMEVINTMERDRETIIRAVEND